MPDASGVLDRKDDAVVAGLEPDAPAAARRRLPIVVRHAQGPRIVVVGGGAGGLELVTRLGDKLGRRGKADVTLVERARTHLWKPLLHEVAAGSMDLDDHALDYLAQAHWHHFRYRVGELIGLDRKAKADPASARPTTRRAGWSRPSGPSPTTSWSSRSAAAATISARPASPSTRSRSTRPSRPPASTAAWSTPACAPTPRPSRCAPASCTSRSSAPAPPAPSSRPSCTAPRARVVAYGLDRIDAEKDIKITLIEAAPRILPALPERLSAATTALLRQLGVDVRTAARVTEVTADGVQLADGGFVPSELVVWAAGVKGPDVLADLDGLEASRTNQLVVDAHPADHPRPRHLRHRRLRLPASCRGHDRPLPPRAQTAHQQATPRPGARSAAGCGPSRSSPSSTATSARWSRSATTRPSAA